MFKPNCSLFAALIFSFPATAKEALGAVERGDIDARLDRAKSIIDTLSEPIDNGGVTRDKADPNKMAWGNWRNWSNWNNFRNNWSNFRNNWHNWHNAPAFQRAPQTRAPAFQAPATTVQRPATQLPATTVQRPAMQVPATTVQRPATQQPATTVQRPAIQQPAATVQRPAAQQPAATVQHPATQSPAATVQRSPTQSPAGTSNISRPVFQSNQAPQPNSAPGPLAPVNAGRTNPVATHSPQEAAKNAENDLLARLRTNAVRLSPSSPAPNPQPNSAPQPNAAVSANVRQQPLAAAGNARPTLNNISGAQPVSPGVNTAVRTTTPAVTSNQLGSNIGPVNARGSQSAPQPNPQPNSTTQPNPAAGLNTAVRTTTPAVTSNQLGSNIGPVNARGSQSAPQPNPQPNSTTQPNPAAGLNTAVRTTTPAVASNQPGSNIGPVTTRGNQPTSLLTETKKLGEIAGQGVDLGKDVKKGAALNVPQDVGSLQNSTTRYLESRMTTTDSWLYRNTGVLDNPSVQKITNGATAATREVAALAPVANSTKSLIDNIKSYDLSKTPADITKTQSTMTAYFTQKMSSPDSALYKTTNVLDTRGGKVAVNVAQNVVDASKPLAAGAGLALDIKSGNAGAIAADVKQAQSLTTDYLTQKMPTTNSWLYQHTQWMDSPNGKTLTKVAQNVVDASPTAVTAGILTKDIATGRIDKLSGDIQATRDAMTNYFVQKLPPDNWAYKAIDTRAGQAAVKASESVLNVTSKVSDATAKAEEWASKGSALINDVSKFWGSK